MRSNDRCNKSLRVVNVIKDFNLYAEGSVLIEFGHTKVICTATVVDKVPPFLKNKGKGWLTAEYAMIPRATGERNQREAAKGKLGGRTMEIQRLIGRALRAAIDLEKLGERTITIDCDVIQADGGTRTTSITGGYIALALAVKKMMESGVLTINPLKGNVAAISVGIVGGEAMIDLDYNEDSAADVDMNIIMNCKGEFVEVQGTGEERPFSREDLNKLLELGEKGNKELIKAQREALGEIADEILGVEYGDEVVIATNNAHKLEEIGDILSDLDYKIYSLKDVNLDGIEIVEDGKTFEHNALIKARTIAKKTNMIAISDDSGLEVDAIGKKPGIYSARFAGENATDEENRQKLIKSLKNIPMSQRSARFVSAIAVVFPDGKEFVVRGTCEGNIGFEEKGKNGFGYDSLFIVDGYNKTFAEIPSSVKNAISHRANALKLMKVELKKRVGK